jgi:nitroreductase
MADDRQPGGLAGNSAQVLDALVFGRRSIRKYKKDPLPAVWLRDILSCALWAPSPSNSQPVRFVHIMSGRHMEALKQSLANGHSRLIDNHKAMSASARLRNRINAYRRYSQFMFTSPVLLAVGVTIEAEGFSSKLAAADLIENDFRQQTDLDMTVGLTLQGLMLKAQSLGVGSCVLTAPLVFMDSVEQLLGLEDIVIKCFVTLGFADEAPKAPERLPLSSVIQVI